MAVTHPFRFGLQVFALHDPEAMTALGRTAEELGFSELFTHDHVTAQDGLGVSPLVGDPFLPLLPPALATERLMVGPLVVNNELHHPVLLARSVASLDRMTDGRAVLGIGTGYAESEHEAIGSPIRVPSARVDRLAESLTVLRSLLDTGSCHHHGEHHHVEVDDLGHPPVQSRIPFVIGANGRRAVRLAARAADVFQFTGLTHGEHGIPGPGGFSVESVRERARWVDEAAGDRDDLVRSALVQHVEVGPDADLAAVGREVGLDGEGVAACPFLLVGSVEQLVDELERRRESLGISHYVVRDAEGFAPVVAALAGR